jgi:hypothetical protein
MLPVQGEVMESVLERPQRKRGAVSCEAARGGPSRV